MISVATAAGGRARRRPRSAASCAAGLRRSCSHADRRARQRLDVRASGASARCQVAWSPTRFTTGVPARRALCRFARPLAKPGPRWSSVSGGPLGHARRSRRQRPCRRLRTGPSTARIRTRSSAATSGSSVVPGFAKQTPRRAGARPEQASGSVHRHLRAPRGTAALPACDRTRKTGRQGPRLSCGRFSRGALAGVGPARSADRPRAPCARRPHVHDPHRPRRERPRPRRRRRPLSARARRADLDPARQRDRRGDPRPAPRPSCAPVPDGGVVGVPDLCSSASLLGRWYAVGFVLGALASARRASSA